MNLSQKVAVNTTVLVVARLVVAASGLAGVAVSTRYLGPEAFGQLTVAIVFVSVFGFFTDAGLYTVTARELAKHPDQERRLLANVFSMGLVLTTAAVVLALLVMVIAYGGSGRGLIRLGVVILASQMLASAAGGTAAAYLVARQRAGPMALAATVSSVIFVGSLLVVVQLRLGFPGIAASFAVSGIVALLFPLVALRGVRFGLAADRDLWRQILRWAVPQGGVLVLGVLYFRLDTFLLSFLSPDFEVARYGVAYRVLEVLMLVPLYVMTTLFPEIARESPHSVRLNEIVQGAFAAVALAVVPLLIVFAGFADDVVAVAGGPRFGAAAPVLRVLTVAVALLFLNTVFFQALVALDRQRNLFFLLVAVLGANLGLNLVLIPAMGAMGAAIALVASEGVVLVFVLRIYAHVGAVPRLRRPGRILVAAAATGAVVIGLRVLLPAAQPNHALGASFVAVIDPLLRLVVAAVVTVGLWGASLVALRAVPSELRTALGALRQRPAPDPVAIGPTVGP